MSKPSLRLASSLVLLGCVLATSSLVLSSCGKGAHSKDAGKLSAEQVALRYAQYVSIGDYSRASKYVIPGDRTSFLHTMSLSNGKLLHGSDISVISIGHGARSRLAVIGGTFCESISQGRSANSKPMTRCISNTSANPKNSAFILTLVRSIGGSWFVVYGPHT